MFCHSSEMATTDVPEDEVTEEEKALRKKLNLFLADLLQVGTVKGFRYFGLYPRGREELLVSVLNEPRTPRASCSETLSDCDSAPDSLSSSFNSAFLPYDQRSLMLSFRSQKALASLASSMTDTALRPASPSDNEIGQRDDNSTLFLLAAYGRYNCPYVWVRSNHARLVKLTGDTDADKDNPLRLKSTRNWRNGDTKVWDILAELVKLCTYPPPLNPFAVDFTHIDSLSAADRILVTGALVNFLQRVVLARQEDKPYMAKVLEDLRRVTKIHFETVQSLSKEGQLPILQQHRQATAAAPQQQPATTRRRHVSWQQPPPFGTSGQNVHSQQQVTPGGSYNYQYPTGLF